MKKILSLTIIMAAINCYGKIDSVVFKQINNQQIELKRIDSIHLSKLDELAAEIDTANQVNLKNTIAREFYSNNITIIITFFSVIITIGIALGGFIIPTWNKRKYQEELTKVKAQFKEMNEQMEENVETKSMAMLGMGFHLQGDTHLRNKLYIKATSDYLAAVLGYLRGGDYHNMRIVAEELLKNCFPKITKEDIVDLFHRDGTTSKEYFEQLKVIDKEDMAIGAIQDLEYNIDKLPDNKPKE